MIVVDTSVWADHLRQPLAELVERLAAEEVLQHPFVTGEVAMGNLSSRLATVGFLQSIDPAPLCDDRDFHAFIEANDLGGVGIGFVDAHLLASAALANARLWTRDRRLTAQAERLGLGYQA